MYRRMIVIGMIMLMGFSLSSAWAFTQSYPSSRRNAPVGSSTLPDYRFRSTSPLLDGSTPYAEETYSPLSSGSNYGPPLKGHWEGDDWVPDEGDNELGTVDDPLPVGDPYCLLLIAAAYGLFVYRRKKA